MSQMRPVIWKTLPGPNDVSRVRLPNSITLLTRNNFNSPSVFISGYMAAGSMFDPLDKLGLADFTASALMRGTERRSFAEIYEQIESVGASLWFSGGTHTTSLTGRALAEDLPLLLDIAADAVRHRQGHAPLAA